MTRATPPLEQQNGRVVWVDFCRVLTAFYVIIRHSDRAWDSLYLFDKFNYHSLVFIFFFLSGYFARPQSGAWLDWKRAWMLAKPWLLWGAVGLCVLLPYYHHEALARGDFGSLSFASLARGMGLTDWNYFAAYNVPLWYLRTLIVLALFAPLLGRLSSKWLAILICGACAVHNLTYYPDALQPDWMPFRTYESVLAAGVFALGMLVRRHADMRRFTAFMEQAAWAPILVSLAVFYMVYEWQYDPAASCALIALGGLSVMSTSILAARHLPRFAARVAAYGPAAFLVFVVHYIVQQPVKEQLIACFGEPVPQIITILTPIAAMAFCLLLYRGIARFLPQYLELLCLVKKRS